MNRREHEAELQASHCRGVAEDEFNRGITETLGIMMKSTATIENLATALSAFAGEIEDAKKGSQAHQYKYADLSTILQLARPLMHKHGLSVVQFPISDSGQVGILTRLMHNSGEWLEQPFMMQSEQSRGMSAAQSIGSILTYFRRYAIAAVLGISQIDDDAAQQAQPPRKKAPPAKLATEAQLDAIRGYIDGENISPRRKTWLNKPNRENATGWSRVTEEQAQTIIDECKAMEAAK